MITEKEAQFKKALYIVNKINRKIAEKKITQEEFWKMIWVTQASINQYLNLSKIYSSEKYYIRMLEALNFSEKEINDIMLEARKIKNNAENWLADNENEEIEKFKKMTREEQREYFLWQMALSVNWKNREAFIADVDKTIDFFLEKYK